MNKKEKKGLLAVFRREMKWISREPSFILMTVVLPLIMFFFFISMFRQGVPRDIPIGIIDADNTRLSRELVRRLNAVPSLEVKNPVTNLEEGRKLLIQGKIYSLVYIQDDFESKATRGLPSEIIHYYNNENQLVGGTIFKDVSSTVRELSGELLKDNLLRKGMSQTQTEAMAEPIAVNTHVLFNPYTNYMYYLLSGILPTMLQFFILLTTIYTVGIELKKSTIQSAMETGGMSVITVLSGKLLPYTMIFSVMGLFMLTLMFKYLGFPLQGNVYLIIGATLLFVLAYQAVGLLFIGLTGNLLKGMLNASFYSSSAFTFTGMTYPMVAMYWPAKVWAQFLPLTHYLNIIVEQAFRSSPMSVTAKSFIPLTIFLFIPFLVLPRLKTLFTDERMWGDWGSL
ncbi:MAG TPA: ABC transporter permease [Spirochaetota bacterium]|nr:ABC transporter permease [Spirochaetota bacterium]HPJ42723.1 ABC transporter permease [Spirochaetota bacterium]